VIKEYRIVNIASEIDLSRLSMEFYIFIGIRDSFVILDQYSLLVLTKQ